ncbi:hypothetical protein F2Q69_00021748 [Brassica cretica]|uniref:Uncharacterized protein n=1 Tax=Brassica cretica TaxID=69181 RepID=A0A8S9QHW2_BRACR|nr:hypothetical protein F2Q69_00021748 [Brassica cretica]
MMQLISSIDAEHTMLIGAHSIPSIDIHLLVTELQPSDHLTSDQQHYADDPLSNTCLHSHRSLGSVSQSSLADGFRSMFVLKYRSAVAHKCPSTDEEYRSTFAEKCRSTNGGCGRSIRISFLCGSCVPRVQGLRKAVIFPCYFWYCWTCT